MAVQDFGYLFAANKTFDLAQSFQQRRTVTVPRVQLTPITGS
jgi:hypothetical protein